MIYFPPSPPPSLTIFGYYHFIYNFLEFKLQRNQYRRIGDWNHRSTNHMHLFCSTKTDASWYSKVHANFKYFQA